MQTLNENDEFVKLAVGSVADIVKLSFRKRAHWIGFSKSFLQNNSIYIKFHYFKHKFLHIPELGERRQEFCLSEGANHVENK